MNKLKSLSYFLLSVSLVACNGLGKMSKNYPNVKHEVTPNPLELHGDSVAVNIKGSYPPKYFAKKVDVAVTPNLKSSTADHNFKTVTNVGESSETSGNKINQKEGGSFTYTDKIAYTADMKAADLMIKATGTKGSKTKELGSVKVADGTIVTPLLVRGDEKPIVAKDNFQRITPANFDGTIYYLINTHTVNSNFKVKQCNIANKTEFALLDSAMKVLTMAPYAIKGVNIMGYASPDGKEAMNADLAGNRSKSTAKHLASQLSTIMSKQSGTKVKMNPDSSYFSQSATNEDWGGFQQLMQQSDMEQKDMILRIVASNTDVEAREMEIKKMGKAYTEIADGVLPKLRRSTITINAERTGRSDEQISALAKSNPDSLSVEEILYAASLTTDNNEKLSIYQTAERLYPQDWRTSNNVGSMLFMKGDVDGAMNSFTKADQLSAGNKIVKNNMGAVYSRKGDRKNAAASYAAAAGAGAEVNENLGILDIRNGNYSTAVSHYGSSMSYNAALAKLLAGDKDGAMSTIDGSADKDSAAGLYLKAVISARKGDPAGVISNLTSCVQKNPAMKSMAAEDREFIKWFSDANFKAIVQ
jgi:Flp pilus assembly protein TadD/outer membrane protein OmpA-like peptidoglycan-associated protein